MMIVGALMWGSAVAGMAFAFLRIHCDEIPRPLLYYLAVAWFVFSLMLMITPRILAHYGWAWVFCSGGCGG